MRNRFAGTCYRCGERVEPGEGHFERHRAGASKWRVQHADCAIRWRGGPPPTREEAKEKRRKGRRGVDGKPRGAPDAASSPEPPMPEPLMLSLPGRPNKRASRLSDLSPGRLRELAAGDGFTVMPKACNRALMERCGSLTRAGELRKRRRDRAWLFTAPDS